MKKNLLILIAFALSFAAISQNVNYKQSDICLGVPVIVGKNGVEKIVDVKLNAAEKEKFASSAAAVKEVNNDLKSVL
jgi:malate dehydrogenase